MEEGSFDLPEFDQRYAARFGCRVRLFVDSGPSLQFLTCTAETQLGRSTVSDTVSSQETTGSDIGEEIQAD